jgi:succinyl-diaminopimelate desuccinylase
MTTDITGYISDWLNDHGISSRIYKKEKHKENLISNLMRKPVRGLIFYGHSDVVPIGDKSRWSFPPYSGRIHGGRVLGRGATDMKGGLAALLFAYKTIAELDVPMKRNLQLTVIPDEENFEPDKKVLYNLIDEGVVSGVGCIMGEPTGPRAIVVGDKGDLWLRVKAKGRPAHGSTPVFGDSAILTLNRAIDAITKIENDQVPTPPQLRGIVSFSRVMIRAYATMAGHRDRAKRAENLVTHTSVNVGTIRGGTMTNVVSESAEAELALCLPAGQTPAKAMKRLKQLTDHVPNIQIQKTFGMNPNSTTPELHFIRGLQSSANSIMNVKPRPFLTTGTSDAHAFRLRGIPTVWYGPGDMTRAHAYDEYVKVKELAAFAKTYFKTAIELCAISPD